MGQNDYVRYARRKTARIVQVLFFMAVAFALFVQPAEAFTLSVVDGSGVPIPVGYRWMLEKDNTILTVPAAPVSDSIGLSIHNSYAPVAAKGHADSSSTNITIPDGRYVVSVLPDSGYSNSAAAVPATTDFDYNISGTITVIVHAFPIPTAQITILAFVDHGPVNNIKDNGEQGLGGCTAIISDAGGQISQDVFGNPLGTVYRKNGDGTINTADIVKQGQGFVTTLTQNEFNAGGLSNPYNLKVGEAVVKYLAPGKYGVVLVPPEIDDNGVPMTWSQTATIEGTPTVDAWVKANEPNIFVEGFGTGFQHVFFGFVKTAPTSSPFKGQTLNVLAWNNPATPPGGTGSIQGTLRYNHFARPPATQGQHAGELLGECWVGLNDPLASVVAPGPNGPEPVLNQGVYAAPCDGNSHFVINNVPPGTYQLVWWDTPLLALFGFSTVTVNAGQNINLGDVFAFRWFGTLQGNVFNDRDQDGYRDPGEAGIQNQNINIRFRDGSIYQAGPTDAVGDYEFSGVFPFFKWLVTEVDFARYKATGMTSVVDYGGAVPPHAQTSPRPPDMISTTPSFDKLNPQPQAEVNPNTGNNLSRTETGPVLTQAMHLFLNQTNVIDWGKIDYTPGENGGISGVVFYATTRAENDPRWAVGETWEPGIPRVQVALYRDNFNNGTGFPGPDGIIDDIDGNLAVQLADVDNYPFQWAPDYAAEPGFTGIPGAEDIDRNYPGQTTGDFDLGDAQEITTTDSWDDNKPSGCIQTLPIIHGVPINECADAFATWNQVRPGLFDGGYAFGPNLPPGTYIVEAVPPLGYELVKEEDKNVDFGIEWGPSLLAEPPVCVNYDENGGLGHLVPPFLTLFAGVDAPYAGEYRPLCDRKQILLSPQQNAAVDFHLYTEVPKAARAFGFTNNDLAAEFNVFSPNFGEKLAPAWIPISFRDWAGKEIVRVYCDEFGNYNALLPSTFSVNIPSPSGVSPNMMTLVLNDPIKPDGTVDPYYNPTFGTTPWTFDYWPGKTTYLDTPLVPLAAFASEGGAVDTEPPTLSPVIYDVAVSGGYDGPVICNASLSATVTIRSLKSQGLTEIFNPDYQPGVLGSTLKITRDYGFGSGTGQVTLNGVQLPIQTWSDASVSVTVPAGSTTGQLMVRRGDNQRWTEIGVTLNIVNCTLTAVHEVSPGDGVIQTAIDAASAGDIILLAPGNYSEMVIMNKPVRLQGAGAGSTMINGNPNPLDRLQAWHDRLNALGADLPDQRLLKGAFSENEAPVVLVVGEMGTFNSGNPFNSPGQAAIDGLRLSGSNAGGGIFAAAAARYLTISNNNITNNQGSYAGGIAIGIQGAVVDTLNQNVTIRYNKIHKNGGTQGPGGIVLHAYSSDYLVENNIVTGNLTRFNGGGIAHIGYSPGQSMIRKNQITFNENFFGLLLPNAGEGGGIYVGGDIAGGLGAGNVTIDSNLIQGNIAGAGAGGGIRAYTINGEDVALSPTDDATWYKLTITNNMIVNNVAGYFGAGIALQDVLRARIINNTIANNDSTATSRLAFTAGQLDSTPQPSGVVSNLHSDLLMGLIQRPGEPNYSRPTLANNIIWHNRSFYNNHLLNAGAGGLSPRPAGQYWDLEVLGTSAFLSTQNSISSSTNNPGFVAPYTNTLTTATVLDEGGNNISVRFTPLSIAGTDYHILSTSIARNNGTNSYLAIAPRDFDQENRPSQNTVDIGADENGPPPPTITVVSPNGGETWGSGAPYQITWTYTGNPGSFVRIDLLKGGVVNRTITTSTSVGTGGNGAYNWTIPLSQAMGTDYTIRIRSTSSSTVFDISDNDFTITGPSITVVTPGAGQIWPRGGFQTINWTYIGNFGGNVRIELLQGGIVQSTIANSTPLGASGNGSYNWFVTEATADNDYQIRVTSLVNGAIIDTSDVFTINGTAPAAVNITMPAGTTNWPAGTTQAIQWTYSGGPDTVMIQLLNGGVSTIAESVSIGTAGNGSYSWAIPAGLTPGNNYQIRITSTNNGAVTSTSPAFTIAPYITGPTVTVTVPNGDTWRRNTRNMIRWTYTQNPGNYVRIELLNPDGTVNRTITNSQSRGTNGNGSYYWLIPSIQTPGSYKVRVTSTSNPVVTHTSNEFTITL